MKKHTLIIASLLVFNIALNAQDSPTKSGQVKSKKTEAVEKEKKATDDAGDKKIEEPVTKAEDKTSTEPKKKTRMAINEKGVPSNATKATEKK